MDFEICNSSDRALNCYGDAHKMSFQLILAPASLAKLYGNAILTSREGLSELLPVPQLQSSYTKTNLIASKKSCILKVRECQRHDSQKVSETL